jgi:molecular chaperone GrpE
MSNPIENATPEASTEPASAESAAAPLSSELRIAELEKALLDAETKAAESYDQFVRSKAEMENIRRRTAEDVLKAQKFGVEKIADALLAVKDSMDAALVVEHTSVESFKTGVELTARQLTTVFEKFSIVEVNPLGEKFDPSKHQSIAALESEQAPNTVINVMQKGYLLHDRVLRPALVTLAKEKVATGNA